MKGSIDRLQPMYSPCRCQSVDISVGNKFAHWMSDSLWSGTSISSHRDSFEYTNLLDSTPKEVRWDRRFYSRPRIVCLYPQPWYVSQPNRVHWQSCPLWSGEHINLPSEASHRTQLTTHAVQSYSPEWTSSPSRKTTDMISRFGAILLRVDAALTTIGRFLCSFVETRSNLSPSISVHK